MPALKLVLENPFATGWAMSIAAFSLVRYDKTEPRDKAKVEK
jgi:hypothetical protein